MKYPNPTLWFLRLLHILFIWTFICIALLTTDHSKSFTTHSLSHTHTLTTEATMQGANCSSGTIRGSVSHSRTFWHEDSGVEDLNKQPCRLLDDPLYVLSSSHPRCLVYHIKQNQKKVLWALTMFDFMVCSSRTPAQSIWTSSKNL